jgi:DNA-binding MarR family transcriptional regulator
MNLTESQQLDLWEIGAIAFFQELLGISKRQAEVFLALGSSHITCTDLSEVLRTTPSAISRCAFHLVLKGLVERDSWNPREKVSFFLTPEGQMILDMFAPFDRICQKRSPSTDLSWLPTMTSEEIEAQLCN